MKRTFRRRAVLAGGLLIALAGGFLLLRPRAVLVDTARITAGPMETTIDEEGDTRVRDRYVVSAPVAGRLLRIALREGDVVRAGDAVARLVPSPLDARAREAALARVAQAEDARRAADAQVRQARAALMQAQRTSERLRDLGGRNLVSPEERERAATDAEARARETEAAIFRAQAAEHDVEAARAALVVGTAGVLVVPAPARGSVLRIPDRSERIVAPGAAVMEIGDPARLEIVVDLLSSDAVQVAPGQVMRVESWGGVPIAGRVRRIEPSGFTRVSALGVEEQRVNVVGELDRPEPALGDRYRVDVRIVTWMCDDVVRVPAAALFPDSAGWAVYVVESGRARRRRVEVGHRTAALAEVLSGLAAGEVVVRYPGDQVRDGVAVRAR